MIRPGIKDLGDFTIAAAGTQTGSWVTGLEGVLKASLQGRFVMGSGGETVKAYLQTSLDQGETAIDIACITFTTSNGRKVVNLSGLTPKTTPATPTDAALSDDSGLDGILGDRFRLKVVSTGTYAGSTTLSGRLAVA